MRGGRVALGSKNLFRPAPRAADVALALDAQAAQANATAIFGSAGTFDSWQRFRSFDMSGQLGPFAVEITVANPVVDFHPFSHAIVGLAWDDASIKEQGPVTVAGGEVKIDQGNAATVLQVSGVRGRSLEVWTSGFESISDARIISVEDAQVIQQQAAQDNTKPQVSPKDAAGNVGKYVAYGVIAVVVVVLAVNLLPVLIGKAASAA